MAKARDDVVGFTRIFVLFCTMVLLPAMLLSGFGIIAAVNARAADKQHRREEAERALRAAEARILELLDATDRAMKAGLSPQFSAETARALVATIRAEGRPVGPFAVLDDRGALLAGEPPFSGDDVAAADLRARALRLSTSASPTQAAHAPIDAGGLSSVVSLQRLSEGRVVVYALDASVVGRALAGAAIDGGMTPSLRIASERREEPVVGALDRLIAEVQRLPDAKEGDAPEELLADRLAPPFERWTIAVTAAPSNTANTTVVVYVVLLLIFYGTLITGVVLTARLIWQETRISRLKTDFVSHVSHELRTPLTSIRMFIETLQLGRARSPEEQQECLEVLAKETERLSEMIERVLGYARLRAGRRPFNIAPQSAGAVVDEAIEAFRAHTLGHDASNLTLEKRIEPGLPPVLADHDALVEALLNLIGNAYKYTGVDKRIVVFAQATGKRVTLGVQDNGPGLPKHEHKRVFERFYQVGSGLLSKQTPGSGLGLAITRAIVEGQGGRIHVESEPGKGATFTLILRTPAAA